MVTAYATVKNHAKNDGTVAKKGKPALDYFAKIGRAGAATKKAKKNGPK